MKCAHASREPLRIWPRPEAEAAIDYAFETWPVALWLRSLARLGVRHNLRLPL